jgi:hypothetical protein
MATQAPYMEWQCPPAAASDERIVKWLDEATEEGQIWLKSQRGAQDFRRAMDMIAGRDENARQRNTYRSDVNPNPLKRNTREVVGALSKLRPLWGYHSDNKAYKDIAEMFNKVTRSWYLESFADRSVREAIQYAAATCRGWIRPIYRRNMYGSGQGEIKLLTYGSPCVLPVQLPSNNDFQSAYAVTILEEMPVAMAHAMFPTFQHLIRPSSSRYWYANDGVRQASKGNILQRIFFGGARRADTDMGLSELLVPIRFVYVIDLSLNTTKEPIPMGEPGASWSYIVPFMGQEIPAGRDPQGRELTRKADENDCRLYPRRRLLISTDQTKLYDGPSFDWHGMFPGVSFCVDDWPWEPLGFSLVHDGFKLNDAIRSIVRGNMDKINTELDLPLAYDTNAVSMAEARAFDPMQPRARIGFDGNAIEGQPFQPVVPAEVFKVSPESMAMVEYLERALDRQLAVQDAMALARMRSVGAMDDLEKLLEANGPIIEDISRSMEPPMRDLGVMLKYLILQNFTTARVMQYVGADGVTPVILDFEPNSIVPSHMPGEDTSTASQFDRRARARVFADNLRFFILPNSLHEYTQMVMKLGLIQLRKAGVWIDSQTIAEAWNVPNYGNIDGNSVVERYWNEKKLELIYAAELQKLAGAEGLTPPGGAPGPAPGGAPPGAPKPNGAAPEGRPPSGQAPPKLVNKDGGARSTITESK